MGGKKGALPFEEAKEEAKEDASLLLLPNGFKRIHHYGLIGSAHKAANLAAARTALAAPAPHQATVESVEAFMPRVTQREWLSCR
ncbi:MAG: hypothetical protein R6W74_07250, partial [Nitrosomonas halophila]